MFHEDHVPKDKKLYNSGVRTTHTVIACMKTQVSRLKCEERAAEKERGLLRREYFTLFIPELA